MDLLLPSSETNSKKISASSSSIVVRSGANVGGIRASKKSISPGSLLQTDKETSAIVKQTKKSLITLDKIANITKKEQKKDIVEYKKEKAEKAREKDKKKKEETEKFLETKTGIEMPKVSGIKLPGIQAPGFFQRFIDALTYLALGWIVDKLIANESFLSGAINLGKKLGEFLVTVLPPFVDGVFKFIEKASPFVVSVGSFLVDSLFWAIDSAESSYNAIRGFAKDKFGDEGVKKLDNFTGILNKFIDGIIIFATAATLIGGDRPPGPDKPGRRPPPRRPGGPARITPGSVRSPSAISKYLSKDPIALRTLRQYGKGGQAIFENSFSNAVASGKTPTQARIIAKKSVERLVSRGKITPQPLSGLSGPGQKAGGILNRGFQRSFNRLGLKVLGRGGLQAVKQFAGRIPIAGPIISAVASLLAGEPISKALVKASGTAIGGFIGGGLTGPLAPLGVIIGSFVGEFLAGTLYEIVTGESDQKIRSVATAAIKTAAMHLSGDLKKITDGIVGLFSLIKDPVKVTTVLGDVIKKVVKSTSTLIQFLLDVVKKLPGGMQAIRAIAGVGKLAQDASAALSKLGSNIASPVTSAVSAVTSTAAQLGRRAVEGVTNQVDRARDVLSPIGDFFGNLRRGADEKIKSVKQALQEKFKKISEFGANIQRKSVELAQNLKGFAGKITESAKQKILKDVINPIKSKVQPLIENVKGMGDKLKKFITENPLYNKIVGGLQKKGVKGLTDFPGIMKAVGSRGLTVIGGLFNLLFAADRLKAGDTSGGILEGLSGVLDLSTLFGFPAGGPLSLTIDAYLLARDLVPEIMEGEKSLFNKIPGFSAAEPGIKNLAQNLPSFNWIIDQFGNKQENKNSGGIVSGYNTGGIVSGYNGGGIVSGYNGGGMIQPSNVYGRSKKSPPKVNTVRYSSTNSSRYDTSKFNRSMEYDDGYIEHTKVIVLVKPAVAV